jgi:hypothetical protein
VIRARSVGRSKVGDLGSISRKVHLLLREVAVLATDGESLQMGWKFIPGKFISHIFVVIGHRFAGAKLGLRVQCKNLSVLLA